MGKAVANKVESGSAAATRSVQDRFLTQMIDEHRKVAVFLISGIKLEGEIIGFDQFVILMKGTMTDKVYKHAVSTIQPITNAYREVAVEAKESTPRKPTIIRRSRPKLTRNAR